MRMPEVMIAILLVLLLAGCKEEKLARGETAPALAAFDLQGKPASLERWEGKAVYLNFWSASCGGCLAEMDTLQTLSQRWPDKLVVVGVNTDPEQVVSLRCWRSMASATRCCAISFILLRIVIR